MFRKVRQFAGFVFLVLLLVASASAIHAAGRSLILRFVDRVAAFASDRWTHPIAAGYHRLEVEGTGVTDLDCFVSDRFGNLLGADTDDTDYCIVAWYQSDDLQVSFRIDNLGHVYNRYEFRLW
jgi:hypothetical protein